MGDSRKESQHRQLNLSPEQALFGPFTAGAEARLDGIVATIHTNERPLQGLAGLLDWHFHGAISEYLRAGALNGATGEISYLPLKIPRGRHARTYHVVLFGAGVSSDPGARQPLDERALAPLRKNIQSLKITRLGISRADFGNATPEALAKQFKEVPVWIVL